MAIRIIVTGATGLAGNALLRVALDDPRIAEVFAWTRRSTGITHPKLTERIRQDFTTYDDVAGDIASADALLWCLGIAQGKVTPETYEQITYDFAVAAATSVATINPHLLYGFLSGQGADINEKSRIRFARIKGKTENALRHILKNLYCFRPGYIRETGHRRDDRSLPERFSGAIAPFFGLFSPAVLINDVDLAKAMLAVATGGTSERVLNNRALRKLSRLGD